MLRIIDSGEIRAGVKQCACGIYEIRHVASARRYVGSSVEVERRLYLHRVMLRLGKHHCAYLQNMWAKYGEGAFSFALLEECAVSALLTLEQAHMDAAGRGLLLNSAPLAGRPLGCRHTLITRQRLSLLARAVASDPEERERRRRRALQQHSEGRLGHRTWTDDSRAKIASSSRASVLVARPWEASARVDHSACWTDEMRLAQAERMRGRALPARTRMALADALRAYYASDSGRGERQSQRCREVAARPGEYARRAERMRLVWAARKAAQLGEGEAV